MRMKNTVSERVKEKREEIKRGGSLIFRRFFERYSEMLSRDLERETFSRRERIRLFAVSVGLTLLGFLFSFVELGEGCYPVSIALICASGVRRHRDGFSPRLCLALAVGAVAFSTLFMKSSGVLYFAVLVTVFVIRGAITKGGFDERCASRVLTSFFTSLLIGVMYSLISDFSLLSLVTLATLVTVTPIFTYLITPLFDSIGLKRMDSRFSVRVGIGWLTVAFIGILALRDFTVIGLSIPTLLSFCVTLCVAKAFGTAWGGAVGVALGIASSPSVAAVLGAVGIVSGLLFPTDLYALLASIPVSVAVSVFVGGTQGFLSTVPEVMSGFLIMWPLLLKIPMRSQKIVERPSSLAMVGSTDVSERLERLSGVFSGLSEAFYAVCTSSVKLDSEKVKSLVESACNGVCATCSASAMCWGKRWRDTKGVLDSIAETIEKKGEVSSDELPEYFRSRCVKSDAICEAVNRVCSAYAREGLEGANRTVGEYRTVSKLLKSTADMFSGYPERSEELAKRVSELLDKLGIKYSYVEAWGMPNTVIDAVGVRMEQVPLSAVELVGIFENVLKLRLSEPEFILEGTPTMRLKRRRAIVLECAKSTCSKKGESVSGDTVTFFENGNGRFYSLICDGMGSGSDAAITSRLASVFLEKLLRCVQDTGVTVELVNRMLLCREDECFTTLDLLEIDLYEKTASFIKAGASASFVFRDGKCYRVNSQTPPAGIIHDLKAEQTTVHLRGGDTVILLSDGILDADDEPELINGSSSEISQELLRRSLLRYSARDDMSVAVIKVLEN